MLSFMCTARSGDIWACYPACTRLGQGVLRYVILRAHGSSEGISGVLLCVCTARPEGSGICYPSSARLGRGFWDMSFCVCTARPSGFWVCYSACARLVRRVLGYVILCAHSSAGGFWGMLFSMCTVTTSLIFLIFL